MSKYAECRTVCAQDLVAGLEPAIAVRHPVHHNVGDVDGWVTLLHGGLGRVGPRFGRNTAESTPISTEDGAPFFFRGGHGALATPLVAARAERAWLVRAGMKPRHPERNPRESVKIKPEDQVQVNNQVQVKTTLVPPAIPNPSPLPSLTSWSSVITSRVTSVTWIWIGCAAAGLPSP